MVLDSVICVVILTAIAIAGIRTAYLGLTLPCALRQKHEPAVCGRCGYAFGMGHGEICPECGTRYIEAGVLTRPLARKLRPSRHKVLVSIGLALAVVWLDVGVVAYDYVDDSGGPFDKMFLVVVGVCSAGFMASFGVCGALVDRRRERIFAPNWDRSRARRRADASLGSGSGSPDIRNEEASSKVGAG